MPPKKEKSDHSIPARAFRNLLKRSDTVPLRDYSVALWQAVKAANPGVTYADHTLHEQALDAMSRLLVGDEICTAIALSGDKVLLATNRHSHLKDSFSYRFSCNVVNKTKNGKYVTLRVKAYLKYNNLGEVEHPEAKELVFRRFKPNGRRREAIYKLTSNKTLSFVFPSREEWRYFFGGEPINLLITAGGKIPSQYDLAKLRVGEIIPLHLSADLELNPFRQRVSVLFDHMAFTLRRYRDTRSAARKKQTAVMMEDTVWSIRARVLKAAIPCEMSTCADYKGKVKPFAFSDAASAKTIASIGHYIDWLIDDLKRYTRRCQDGSLYEEALKWRNQMIERIKKKKEVYASTKLYC